MDIGISIKLGSTEVNKFLKAKICSFVAEY
jgi:hypothetical protein